MSIFRQQSQDRMSEPDRLDDYIKVTTPAVWMTVAVMLLLIVAGVVWMFVGDMGEGASMVDMLSQVE